ncbi:MAG: MoaD/ThiS family protein [Bacteroidales bacterium]
MKINLLLFGILTDIAGTSKTELKDIESVTQVKSWLWRNYPKSKDIDFQIAINGKIIEGKADLKNGDEVALLPPFAGG